ncbi:2208_t:CDS:2 [Entrophospora sp. SA101]|nr:2208_t:CDS:2 [Entrophospora sp. SA101]
MYKISNPNQYLIKTGAFIKDIEITKKGWVLPGQHSRFFDITPVNYTLQLQAMSAERLEFNLPAVFTIGPKDEPVALYYYAKLLFADNKNSEYVKDLVRGIIEGETRVIAAGMTMEEMFRERRRFKEKVIKNVQAELDQFGLYLRYIYVLYPYRMKTHEGAVQQATVDVSEAKYRGDVGVKEREGLTRQLTSKIEAETVLVENESNAIIAEANATLSTKKSEYDKNTKIAAIEATQAAKIWEYELQKGVEELRLLSETERLRVLYASKATAEYEASKSIAESKFYTAQQEAEAQLYRKKKEAEGVLPLFNAQAEGIKNLTKAFGDTGDLTMEYLMIKHGAYKDLARENAQAIKGLDPKITVWNNNTVAVECPYVKSPTRNSKFDSQIINSKNNFIINFECQLPDNKQCDKAKFAFENSGVILTSALSLNTPIIINATFTIFDGPIADLIGAAGPFRFMPLKDNDGIERLYPQALVKQFQFDSHPEFSSADIVAQFNSKSPFWFEGDPPIRKDQIGFQELVLHELLHGLGFISSLDDYIHPVPKIITPEIVGLKYTSDGVDTKSPIKFKGFIEMAFDKYIVFLSDGKLLSNTTAQINQLFTGSGDTTSFANLDAFIKAFSTTPQFKIGQKMLDVVTKEKTLGFLPHDKSSVKDSVILETSLKPFQHASSISHVDYKTYTNTSEFLMTFLQESGRTLNDSIAIGGNLNAGAIGPQTLSILETLGYEFLINFKLSIERLYFL